MKGTWYKYYAPKYLGVEQLPLNTKICHYFKDISFLLPVLLGTFRFDKKGGWPDPHERGEHKSPFLIYPAKEDVPQEKLKEHQERMKDIRSSKELYASCWMIKETDSALMWSGREHGACIFSTIDDVVGALNVEDDEIVCGQIRYTNSRYESYDFADFIFEKAEEYSEEKEFRFYLDQDGDKDYKEIAIDPSVLIRKIILGPKVNFQGPASITIKGNTIKIIKTTIKF